MGTAKKFLALISTAAVAALALSGCATPADMPVTPTTEASASTPPTERILAAQKALIAEGPTPGTLIEQSTGSGKTVFNLSGLTDKQKLIGLVINCDGPGGWSAGISSEQGISGSGDCSPTNHGSMTFAPADPAEVSSVTVDVPAGTTFWITIYSNRQLAYDSIY